MVETRQAAIALLLLLLTGAALALEFPALTGRVVDQAGLLSAATSEQLEMQLADHEQATTNQVVIVTLQSLQETTIEDFGYQLGRHWKIGQQDKDNGVLLIVAPNERKVRIEVGYGLEGTLTDAISHTIIQRRILPAFKRDDMAGGIVSGTEAILATLNDATPEDLQPGKSTQHGIAEYSPILMFLTLGAAQLIGIFTGRNKTIAALASGIAGIVTWVLTHFIPLAIFFAVFVFLWMIGGGRGGGSGRSGGSWSGGGGFSGGGGSFGGGGASGSW